MVTGGYEGLQRVKWLQGDTGGYKELQGGYKGFELVRKGYSGLQG